METKIVNVLEEEYEVYIRRPNPKIPEKILGADGFFGNPFRIGKGHFTREESLNKFKRYLHKKVNEDKEFKEAVEKLKGKTLGCWCKPKECHGDIYKEYLEN